MPTRFLDDGRTIYDFGETFLVQCPRCDRRAIVAILNMSSMRESAPYPPMDDLTAPRHLVCTHCGHTRDWPHHEHPEVPTMQSVFRQTGMLIGIGEPYDWYFRLPLWLQTPCCGHILWAYNADHLGFLFRFVTADLREGNPHRNQSLASRVPGWMKDSKNRAQVTHRLQRLWGRLGKE